ncbi:MAG: hypothetical protein K6G45_13550 [Lachnospiraceae bacterium]|nr:hypothetical protein [Lachnospiraceae bacterium]
MKKDFSRFVKLFIALFCMLITILAAGTSVKAAADSGKTVTVTSAKELKAAIAKADVDTIILHTEKRGNEAHITIKSSKAAKTKNLIIDAPYAVIVNKAVFADIDIKRVERYTEKVSGNNITYRGSQDNNFIIAAKKKVNKLTLCNSDGYFYGSAYLLRKGAKINTVEFVYTGGKEPVTGSYDKAKRKSGLKFVNLYDCKCTMTIKLDKKGRITRSICKSDGYEFAYDCTYVYDTNGNIVKSSGSDYEGGFEKTCEYSKDGKLMKTHTDGMSVSDTIYEYDKRGQLVTVRHNTEDSIDGLVFWVNLSVEYSYDAGRLTGKIVTDTTSYKDDAYPALTSITDYSYTYKHGLLDEESYHVKSDNEDHTFTHRYEYDDEGYLKKEEVFFQEAGDETETLRDTYEYDREGNLIG